MTTKTAARANVGPTGPGPALEPEVTEFLVDFSVGVHRYSMYPPAHPALHEVAETVESKLKAALKRRIQLTLGVARSQVLVDGVASSDRNPLLAELAKRLHAHQIGAITFGARTTARELAALFQALSAEAERDGEPLGLTGRSLPDCPSIQWNPVGYDDLELADDAGPSEEEGLDLWLALAQAAALGDVDHESDSPPEARDVAARINATGGFDPSIVGYLVEIAEGLSGGGGSGSLRTRVSELIAGLDDESLTGLVHMEGDVEKRAQFVRSATRGLKTTAAIRILAAAAAASEQGISRQMVRLLTKLSRHAESGGGAGGDLARAQLDETVEALLVDWTLESPNPDDYVRVLDGLSQTSPLLTPASSAARRSAFSLVKMALEIEGYGAMVADAIDELVSEGKLSKVAALIEEAESSPAVQGIRKHLGSPEMIERFVTLDDPDEASLHLLVDLVGEAQAIPPLLDALVDSDSRGTRRVVFDALVAIGPSVAAHAAPLLADDRWYVVRNILSLLGALSHLPEASSVERLLGHADVRVRREAVSIALHDEHLRPRALSLALADDDERLVRIALADLERGLPASVLPVLAERVTGADLSEDLRVLGVRTLSGQRTPQALSVLVSLVHGGRTVFLRTKLKPVSDAMLAALGLLAGEWRNHPTARPLLRAAGRSKRAAVRRVLGDGA